MSTNAAKIHVRTMVRVSRKKVSRRVRVQSTSMEQDVKVSLTFYQLYSLVLQLLHEHNRMQIVTVCKHYHDSYYFMYFATKAS